MDVKQKLLSFSKKKNNIFISIIILVGICLMMLPSAKSTADKDKNGKTAGKDAETQAVSAEISTVDNEKDLEKKLEDILSNVSGVGEAQVMITFDATREKSLAYDTILEDSEVEEENGAIKKLDTQQKSQKNAIFTDETPVVIKEIYPTVRGAIIVAKGAGDAKIKLDIINAVRAVLDIEAHKVQVFKKGD